MSAVSDALNRVIEQGLSRDDLGPLTPWVRHDLRFRFTLTFERFTEHNGEVVSDNDEETLLHVHSSVDDLAEFMAPSMATMFVYGFMVATNPEAEAIVQLEPTEIEHDFWHSAYDQLGDWVDDKAEELMVTDQGLPDFMTTICRNAFKDSVLGMREEFQHMDTMTQLRESYAASGAIAYLTGYRTAKDMESLSMVEDLLNTNTPEEQQ